MGRRNVDFVPPSGQQETPRIPPACANARIIPAQVSGLRNVTQNIKALNGRAFGGARLCRRPARNVAMPNVLNLRTSILHELKPPAPCPPLPAPFPFRRSAANLVACFSKSRRTLLPLLGGEGRGEVGRHTNFPSCFHSSNAPPVWRSATVSQTSRRRVAMPNVFNLRTNVLHELKPPAPCSPPFPSAGARPI